MKGFPTYDFSKSRLPKDKLSQCLDKCSKRQDQLKRVLQETDHKSPEASILLPNDKKHLWESKKLCKKHTKASLIIVVGIGGSNLGTKAIYEALFSYYRTVGQGGASIMFADSPDPTTLEDIIKIARLKLANSEHIILNLISKSGTTLESLTNFSIIHQNLKDSENLHILFTTDEGSKLDVYAQNNNIDVLRIPKQVGGRFSVFSNVGLFPLLVAGADCSRILDGAKKALEQGLEKDSPAAQTASFLHLHSKRGLNQHVSFMFSNRLVSAAAWYRQLMGESVAKEKDVAGNDLNSGITPISAIGSTDLHSMAQLFLAGPKDKTYRFVDVHDFATDFKTPKSGILNELSPDACSKDAGKILNTICTGVKTAFEKSSLPLLSIRLSHIDELNLGYLMQMEMIEMILLGDLMGVNPFDQPAVERYKTETKRLMQK